MSARYLNDVVFVAHAVRCAWPAGLQLFAWEPLAVPPGLGDALTRHRPAGASRESSWYNVDGIIQELVCACERVCARVSV